MKPFSRGVNSFLHRWGLAGSSVRGIICPLGLNRVDWSDKFPLATPLKRWVLAGIRKIFWEYFRTSIFSSEISWPSALGFTLQSVSQYVLVEAHTVCVSYHRSCKVLLKNRPRFAQPHCKYLQWKCFETTINCIFTASVAVQWLTAECQK